MVSNVRLFEWDDFSAGEFGLTNPSKAARNSFTGLNVVPLSDGSVAPRSGAVRLVANSGGSLENGFHRIGWTKMSAAEPLGRVWWLGYPTGNVKYGLLSNFNDASGAWSTYTGGPVPGVGSSRSFGSVNTQPERTFLVGTNTELVRLNHDSNSLTTFTPGLAPKGRCIALYGQRLYVGAATLAGTGAENRVHYSDANAFGSWAATGYFDLPIASRIVAMHTQRDHLVIIQATGNVWIFSGVPGANATLRQVSSWSEHNDLVGTPETTGDLVHCNQWVRTNAGAIWWTPQLRPVPTQFDGGRVSTVDRLRMYPLDNTAGSATVYSGAALDGPDDFALDCGYYPVWDPWAQGQGNETFDGAGILSSQTHSMLVRHQSGAWSRHSIFVQTEARPNASVMCQGPYGSVLYAYSGGAADSGVWWWQPSLIAPAEHRTSGINGPGDMASCRDNQPSFGASLTGVVPAAQMTTTEAEAPAGQQWRVRELIVTFTAYNTGNAGDTCHFDVVLERRSAYQQPTDAAASVPADTTALSFDIAAASVHGTVGVGRRFTRRFAIDAGRVMAAAVTIRNMRGVKIEKITGLGAVEPARAS